MDPRDRMFPILSCNSTGKCSSASMQLSGFTAEQQGLQNESGPTSVPEVASHQLGYTSDCKLLPM